jgi:hypothetical protein
MEKDRGILERKFAHIYKLRSKCKHIRIRKLQTTWAEKENIYGSRCCARKKERVRAGKIIKQNGGGERRKRKGKERAQL